MGYGLIQQKVGRYDEIKTQKDDYYSDDIGNGSWFCCARFFRYRLEFQ